MIDSRSCGCQLAAAAASAERAELAQATITRACPAPLARGLTTIFRSLRSRTRNRTRRPAAPPQRPPRRRVAVRAPPPVTPTTASSRPARRPPISSFAISSRAPSCPHVPAFHIRRPVPVVDDQVPVPLHHRRAHARVVRLRRPRARVIRQPHHHQVPVPLILQPIRPVQRHPRLVLPQRLARRQHHRRPQLPRQPRRRPARVLVMTGTAARARPPTGPRPPCGSSARDPTRPRSSAGRRSTAGSRHR